MDCMIFSILGSSFIGVLMYFQGVRHGRSSAKFLTDIQRMEGQLDVISQFRWTFELDNRMKKRSKEAPVSCVIASREIANYFYKLGYFHRIGVDYNLARPSNVSILSEDVINECIPIGEFVNDTLDFIKQEHQRETEKESTDG